MKNSWYCNMTKPRSIKLRVRVKDDQDNLFVRLGGRVLKDLLGDDPDNSFLPLSISFGDTTVYASWNGGISQDGKSTSYKNRIETTADERFSLETNCHYHRTIHVEI